jgi:hypothetical protein
MGASGITVMNLSDPGAPSSVGYFAPPGSSNALALSDDVLAVGLTGAGNDPGVYLYSLAADPSDPLEIGEATGSTYPVYEMAVAHGYAYTIGGQTYGLQIFDITTPNSPSYVTRAVSDMDGGSGPPSPTNVVLAGDVLFYLDWPEESGPSDAGIHVHRATEVPSFPEEPAEWQIVQLNDEYDGVTDGSYLYAYKTNEIRIYPITQ